MPIISAYQPSPSLPAGVISGIVRFFVEARKLAPGLTDGSAAPAYNLRSLARAMQYVAHAVPLHGLQRSLFDGFSMAFAGMLDAEGAAAIGALVQKHVLGGRAAPGLPGPSKSAPAVLDQSQECHVNVEVRPGSALHSCGCVTVVLPPHAGCICILLCVNACAFDYLINSLRMS